MLYNWTFSKFMSRLNLMHDMHATFVEDPDNFELDPLIDPWNDGEPGEMRELVLAHAQELSDARLVLCAAWSDAHSSHLPTDRSFAVLPVVTCKLVELIAGEVMKFV